MNEDIEMAKNNFLMNDKWNEVFSTLPDDKAGQLIKAAFSYHTTGEFQIDDPVLNAVFNMIKSEIDENDRRYEEICERNRQNVSRRYTKKNEKLPEATTVDDRIPLATDNDIDNDNDLKEKGILTDTQKESEPLIPAAREIVSYLNEKTGSSYSASSKNTVKLIKARMNEGHTTDDFKKVIDNKAAEWKGTEMEGYLRPNTLFAPSHFDDYLNQKGVKRTQKPPDKPWADPKRKKDKFFNFPQRDDAESRDLVQELIRRQTAGGA